MLVVVPLSVFFLWRRPWCSLDHICRTHKCIACLCCMFLVLFLFGCLLHILQLYLLTFCVVRGLVQRFCMLWLMSFLIVVSVLIVCLVFTSWWLIGYHVASNSCVPFSLHLLLIHTCWLHLLLILDTLWGSLHLKLQLVFFWDGIPKLRGSTWSSVACFCIHRLIVPSCWMDRIILDWWVVCFSSHPWKSGWISRV